VKLDEESPKMAAVMLDDTYTDLQSVLSPLE
jgi:hypothetical protein